MDVFYNVMLYGGLSLAIIFAIISVVLFFVLKIPKAIGDVTGATARKKIEEIRERGYESVQGAGASKQDAIKKHTSRISVRDIRGSSTTRSMERGRANYERAIAEISEMPKKTRMPQKQEEATDVLHEDMHEMNARGYEDETDLLRDDVSEEATDVLRDDIGEEATDVLRVDDADEEATDILRMDDADEEATDILRMDDADEEATDILRMDDADEEETDILRMDDVDEEATDILRMDDADEEATDVLRTDDSSAARRTSGMKESSVKIVKSIVVVHTDESI